MGVCLIYFAFIGFYSFIVVFGYMNQEINIWKTLRYMRNQGFWGLRIIEEGFVNVNLGFVHFKDLRLFWAWVRVALT
jgi:hypothetical protein